MGRIGFRFEFLMRLCELVCVCVLASDARELSATYVCAAESGLYLGKGRSQGPFQLIPMTHCK